MTDQLEDRSQPTSLQKTRLVSPTCVSGSFVTRCSMVLVNDHIMIAIATDAIRVWLFKLADQCTDGGFI